MSRPLRDLTSASHAAIYPQSLLGESTGCETYLRDPAVGALREFFQKKGLTALKLEDQREAWYEDWLAFGAKHRLYAGVLSPKEFSTLGGQFDLLRYTRFLEAFAQFSPAHGYSLQVSFLGLFAILMGQNAALKREAVAVLESGGLLAFGVSEKEHGSDLLATEFTIKHVGDRWVADGKKYYIGNANAAGMIAVLARKEEADTAQKKRAPLALFALRPKTSPGTRRERWPLACSFRATSFWRPTAACA